jgi:site-specific DNA recombinase
VIYCRVSTKEQAQTNLSLPVQKKVCVEYCEREGLDVDKLFMERGESAKTIDRPEFQKLLSYCRQNKGRVQVGLPATMWCTSPRGLHCISMG